jgi:hypothetical protein
MLGAQNALGLHGRLAIKGLGLGELSLVAEDISLIGDRQNIVGVIGTNGALDAVRIEIGKMLGVGELLAIP